MHYENCFRRPCAVKIVFFIWFLTAALLVSTAKAEDGEGTHLYFITSHGCAPCRQVEPAIEALKREGYPVTTVQYGEHAEWARQLGVDRTPTVVMISDRKMVGRHAGIIDAVTLKKWFSVEGVKAGSVFGGNDREKSSPGGTKVVLGQKTQAIGAGFSKAIPGRAFSSSTMHRGTDRPANSAEQRALAATVRLRVEDPKGISYATGTVIHSYGGESLVVTCGHVFREAKGAGEITAEYGFADGNKKTAVGELIFYDADARDIGLVAIRTPEEITPIDIAERNMEVDKGRDVFSIGCDHGEDPTIRRSRIKNRAAYDGAIKYDIFGRPVSGRSGGGLFTANGELVGVCNAAAVEVDEGIYTALDTVYWQLAQVNLNHLFDGSTQMASANNPSSINGRQNSTMPNQVASVSVPSNRKPPRSNLIQSTPSGRLARIQSRSSSDSLTPVAWNRGGLGSDRVGSRPAGFESGSDKEVVIVVRSKSNPSQSETITIGDPSAKLLNYLGTMNQSQVRQVDVAQLRTENRRR